MLYDPERLAKPPLTDVDNVTVHKPSGDLYVCEDNGGADAYDVGVVTFSRGPRGRRRRPVVSRFAKLTGAEHGDPGSEAASEVAGVCFNPSGDRMYFASQRAFGVGVVYEVTGPFRRLPGRAG